MSTVARLKARFGRSHEIAWRMSAPSYAIKLKSQGQKGPQNRGKGNRAKKFLNRLLTKRKFVVYYWYKIPAVPDNYG